MKSQRHPLPTEKNLKGVNNTLALDRMPPIPEHKLTEAQKQAAAELIAGPRKSIKGPFVALIRSPELMRRLQKVGEYIRFICPLDKRINEFAVLIIARHWSQQFEWWAHYPQAIGAGLNSATADSLGDGRRPVNMAEDEQIVYDFLQELLNNKCVTDATYQTTVAKFGEMGTIDLLGIAGYYGLLAMIMIAAQTPVPEG